MKSALFVAAFVMAANPLSAQDSALALHHKGIDIDLNIAGGWYKQNPGTSDPSGRPHVYVPGALPRRRNDLATQNNWGLNNDYMTDNPLWHGCVYLDIGIRGRIGSDLTLYGDIIGEQRGFSGGLYNTSNLVVYPKLKAVFNRSFRLFRQNFTIDFTGGFRDSLRQLEGLTVYNVDADNARLYVQWKRLRYTASHIGDMVFTGLGIDDQVMDMLSLEALPLGKKWMADLRLASIDNITYEDQSHADISLAAYLPGRLRLYMQWSKRFTNEAGDAMAGLAGLNGRWQRGRLSFSGFLEGRYYGAAYNNHYIYEGVYYRPKRPVRTATDFVGEYLYPLMNFERPYNKWAVFTEHQGRNVMGLNVYSDITCRLFDHFFANALFDINFISPSGQHAYWLPFYRVGIGYEVLRENFFLVSLTNKGMNLDKHYQDFYLLKEPCVQIQFTRRFSWQ